MKNETKNCVNCKKNFTIELDDFSFYEKMKVPSPIWCPECRMIRRFSFMNIRTLYKRPCDLCEKSTISMYAPEKNLKVYCDPCWWGDSWNGDEYAMDYDSSRNFFEQMKELRNRTPFMALECLYASNINSTYTNYTAYQKNSYLTYFGDYTENCMYCMILAKIRDCVDCYRIYESELCYESIGGFKLYNCYFTIDCSDCHDVHFSRNCFDCSNCFGCVNLRKKSYCIWNKQYTKEEYKEKMAEIDMASHDTVEKTFKKLKDFSMKFPRRFYRGNTQNKNVSGEYISFSKNAHDVYIGFNVEDSKYVQFLTLAKTKDAYDYTGWGYNSEKLYECAVVGEGAYNCTFSNECWPNAMNVDYSMYANSGSKDCFGCVNIKKKQYCILNKQYTKEQYEKLKAQIISDMYKNPYVDEKGRIYKYGEFLPIMMSPFGYNKYMRKVSFVMGEHYHIYNRGTDKRNIFVDEKDLLRFWENLFDFNQVDPIGSVYEFSLKKKSGEVDKKIKPLVQFVAYCINPNHFHFLITPLHEKGIEKFMQRLGNGYTKYFNNKHKRSGVLFQGKFKSKHIDSNEYLLHLSAYINGNNKLGHRMSKLSKSSLREFLNKVSDQKFCKKDIILGQFRNRKEYEDFITSSLEDIVLRKEMLKELDDY